MLGRMPLSTGITCGIGRMTAGCCSLSHMTSRCRSLARVSGRQHLQYNIALQRLSRIPLRYFSTAYKLNSAYIENEHSRVLLTKLSQKTSYKYLDPDIYTFPEEEEVVESSNKLPTKLIKALKSREESLGNDNLEKELETFKDWARSAQLRVGFLLHINENIHSKQYLNKVIQTLALEDIKSLQPHEVITLLLLIYFRKDMTVEEIIEFLDLDALQSTLGNHITNKRLSPEEIIAACLGLKKIKGLIVNKSLLRDSLYNSFAAQNIENDIKDFFFITLMTTLSRGGQIYHDNELVLQQAMINCKPHLSDVSLMTAVKMMSFGISCNVEVESLSKSVCNLIEDKLNELNSKDILSLTNFFSKSHKQNELLEIRIKGEISRLFEEAESLETIVDVFKSMSYLANNAVYRIEVSKPILDAFCDILPSEVNLKNLDNISKIIIERIVKDHKNEAKILATMTDLSASQSGTICRVAAALCFNMRIDEVEIDHNMSMDTAAAILALFYKKIPLQMHSPQMPTVNLETRSRCLVNCYRGLVQFLGSERFCGVGRLLPQYPEPDIVFGVLAGTPVQIPDYITDQSILRPKRAPPGDWWAIVVATRKNLNTDQELSGVDAAKVRQLKWLGFQPVIMPYSSLLGEKRVATELYRALKLERVNMPNLDDGFIQENRKF